MVRWTTNLNGDGENVEVLDTDWDGASEFGFNKEKKSFYCVCDGERYWFPAGVSNPIAYLSMHYQGNKNARKMLLRNLLYGEGDDFLDDIRSFIEEIKEHNDEDSDDS